MQHNTRTAAQQRLQCCRQPCKHCLKCEAPRSDRGRNHSTHAQCILGCLRQKRMRRCYQSAVCKRPCCTRHAASPHCRRRAAWCCEASCLAACRGSPQVDVQRHTAPCGIASHLTSPLRPAEHDDVTRKTAPLQERTINVAQCACAN